MYLIWYLNSVACAYRHVKLLCDALDFYNITTNSVKPKELFMCFLKCLCILQGSLAWSPSMCQVVASLLIFLLAAAAAGDELQTSALWCIFNRRTLRGQTWRICMQELQELVRCTWISPFGNLKIVKGLFLDATWWISADKNLCIDEHENLTVSPISPPVKESPVQ